MLNCSEDFKSHFNVKFNATNISFSNNKNSTPYTFRGLRNLQIKHRTSLSQSKLPDFGYFLPPLVKAFDRKVALLDTQSGV